MLEAVFALVARVIPARAWVYLAIVLALGGAGYWGVHAFHSWVDSVEQRGYDRRSAEVNAEKNAQRDADAKQLQANVKDASQRSDGVAARVEQIDAHSDKVADAVRRLAKQPVIHQPTRKEEIDAPQAASTEQDFLNMPVGDDVVRLLNSAIDGTDPGADQNSSTAGRGHEEVPAAAAPGAKPGV